MHRGKRAWWLLLAVAVVSLDLWSKDLWDYPKTIHDPPVFQKKVVENWLYVETVYNTGAVWSLPLGQRLLLYGTALAVPLILLWIFWAQRVTRLETAAKALILGGAVGNLWDRYHWRAVRDWINFYYGEYPGKHWPTFNVADMCLVCGICGLLILSFVHDRKKKQAEGAPEATA